ncbi:hypothetical protein T484DRAFT_3368337 [Baffinella frigidus]|nr:hypothetical protein T484DRAFT_3368337 [Cryptophyta sp. CCMP2293]
MLNLTPSPSLHLVAAVLFLALPLVASFKNCEVKADCNFVGCSDGAAFGLEYDCLECWNNCNTADQCCGDARSGPFVFLL